MSSASALDLFITNSLQLLNACQESTKMSFTFKNVKEEGKQSSVKFKARNSQLGAYYKFRTRKAKDVSRMLSALGPRGVSVTVGQIERKKRKCRSKDLAGMTRVMVGEEVKEYVPEAVGAASGEAGVSAGVGKSKKGKKSKKSRKR